MPINKNRVMIDELLRSGKEASKNFKEGANELLIILYMIASFVKDQGLEDEFCEWVDKNEVSIRKMVMDAG